MAQHPRVPSETVGDTHEWIAGHVNRYSRTGQMPSLEEARADLRTLPLQLRAAAARALVVEGLVDPWCALSLAAFGLWTIDPTTPDAGLGAA